jgi:hypothetical protein
MVCRVPLLFHVLGEIAGHDARDRQLSLLVSLSLSFFNFPQNYNFSGPLSVRVIIIMISQRGISYVLLYSNL